MTDTSVTDYLASIHALLSDDPDAAPSATKAAARVGLARVQEFGDEDLPRLNAFVLVLDKDEQLRLALRQSTQATLAAEQEAERKRDEDLKVALQQLMESRTTADADADSRLTSAKGKLQALKNTIIASAQRFSATQPGLDFGAIANTPDPEDIDGVLWQIVILSLLTYQVADANLAEQIQANADECKRIQERVEALEQFIKDLFPDPSLEADSTPNPSSGGATPAPNGAPPASNEIAASVPGPTFVPKSPWSRK